MLTAKQFSEESGLTHGQVYDRIRRGTLRSKKVGSKRLIYPNQETIPVQYRKKQIKKGPNTEGFLTMTEASKKLGITSHGVKFRVVRGWYKEHIINGIRHIHEDDLNNKSPHRKEREIALSKKTLRKCSCCGKDTQNRMLCDVCFKLADDEVIY